MSRPPPDEHTLTSPARWAGPTLMAVALLVYVGLLLVLPPSFLGADVADLTTTVQARVNNVVAAGLRAIGFPHRSLMLRHGAYLIVVGLVIPWAMAALLRRGRPRDIGLRRPNALAPRILLVSVLLALPFLAWMVRSPGIAESYVAQFRPAPWSALAYYLVNMASEHVLLHGVTLGLCRPGLRWPAPPPVDPVRGSMVRRGLRWIGLAQTTGAGPGRSALTVWLGLPPGCIPAICTSGVLFGLVHVGKDPRELMLSVPGGFASAFLAYRTNSLLVPFALHLLTAGAALLMMMMIS